MIFKDEILRDLNNSRPNYCHAIEVNNTYEIESTIEQLYLDFTNEQYNLIQILYFFNTIEVYYLGSNEKEESEVHNFDLEQNFFELIDCSNLEEVYNLELQSFWNDSEEEEVQELRVKDSNIEWYTNINDKNFYSWKFEAPPQRKVRYLKLDKETGGIILL